MSSEPCQVPQIPVKVDKRKIMTEEKLERLRLSRETRAKNRLLREEKRMEVAKQFLLASAGVPESKTVKSSPEEKARKWEARKNEILEEMSRKIGEANLLAMKKSKEPVPELETQSEFSEIEETPAKRPKKEKKPKKSKPAAVPKPSKTIAKKSSSSTGPNAYERDTKRRKPVPPAVMSEESSETESTEDDSSGVEQEHVLKLW